MSLASEIPDIDTMPCVISTADCILHLCPCFPKIKLHTRPWTNFPSSHVSSFCHLYHHLGVFSSFVMSSSHHLSLYWPFILEIARMKDRQTRIKSRVSSRKIVWPSARQYPVTYSHVEFHLLQLLSVRGETARKGNFSELSRFADTWYFLYFDWISGLALSCSLIWQKKNKNSLCKRERLSRLIINLVFFKQFAGLWLQSPAGL